MTFLNSLPADASLIDLYRRSPALWRPLVEFHQVLMRGPSPFTVAERELLAAFVSGLNDCEYCLGVHHATAVRFGIAPDLLRSLLTNIDRAEIDDRLRSVFRYAEQLTERPDRVCDSFPQAMRAVGWNDEAITHTVAITGLYNQMNRLTSGLGILGDDGYFSKAGDRLHASGYAGLLPLLDDAQDASESQADAEQASSAESSGSDS